MREIPQLDKSESKDAIPSMKNQNDQDTNVSNSKRKKIFIFISIISIIIILCALAVILCVCLLKNKKNKTEEEIENITEEEIPDMMYINLDVNSDNDNKEVFFLSDEFNEGQNNLRN